MEATFVIGRASFFICDEGIIVRWYPIPFDDEKSITFGMFFPAQGDK